MKRILLALLILLLCNVLHAQSAFNFGMENNSIKGSLPDNWVRFSKNTGYTAKIDSIEKHSDKYSLLIEKLTKPANGHLLHTCILSQQNTKAKKLN